MDRSVLGKKSSFQMLGLPFYSKLDSASIAKTACKKIGALLCSIEFFSPEVAVYVCKSTKQLCMEYCCHVWAGAPRYYLDMLNKSQKWVSSTVGRTLSDSLELLGNRKNVVSLSLFYRYYLDVHLNWLNRFHLLIFLGGPSLF